MEEPRDLPSSRPRLALFSGLGIDHNLYTPQRDLPGVRVEMVPWLPVRDGESLADYAHRLARQIDPTPPLYLGGVSFGAMLAIEAATVVRPRGVFNVAGARRGDAVSPLVKMTCTLAGRMSESMVRLAMGGAGLLIRMVGRPDRREREFLLELARDSLPWLTRWGCGAMLRWRAPDEIGCPIHHVHGDRDHLIPLANVTGDGEVEMVVPGGGHIINVTHADVVNRFIVERLGTTTR